MGAKLTKAQMRMLVRARRGAWLRGSSEHQLAERLYRMGLVWWPVDQDHAKKIELTDAGKQALAAAQKDGDCPGRLLRAALRALDARGKDPTRRNVGKLHVWTADSEDWVVAESAERARDLFCAQMGFDAATGPEPDDDREFGTHPSHWEPLPDDRVLKMREECPEHHKPGVACPRGCDEEHVVHHAKTCAEWAAGGAAYLGSANW